jgi:hypothetical protein
LAFVHVSLALSLTFPPCLRLRSFLCAAPYVLLTPAWPSCSFYLYILSTSLLPCPSLHSLSCPQVISLVCFISSSLLSLLRVPSFQFPPRLIPLYPRSSPVVTPPLGRPNLAGPHGEALGSISSRGDNYHIRVVQYLVDR